MRATAVILVVTPLLVAALQPPAAASESGAYRIVLPRRALGAGEHVELKLKPPPPPGVRVNFGVAVGAMGFGLDPPVYRAPYVIPPGTPPAKVSAGFSAQGLRVGVSTEIELLPGSAPGAEDCLGPGQSFSSVWGDIEPHYTQLDELPHLVQSVEPEYPRSAFVRGIEDTIPVGALLCRTGRVLDAYPLSTYRDTRDVQPIERDPKLVEAAVAAVRHYVFSPGMAAGHPVALWINTAVVFRR